MRITQKSIAEMCGVSEGHLSQVLSGTVCVGKRVAMSFEKLSGKSWTDFLVMKPDQIRKVLTGAATRRKRVNK